MRTIINLVLLLILIAIIIMACNTNISSGIAEGYMNGVSTKGIGDSDFDDVYGSAILYDNDSYDADTRLGLDKCMEEVALHGGNCMDNYYLGSAWWFKPTVSYSDLQIPQESQAVLLPVS